MNRASCATFAALVALIAIDAHAQTPSAPDAGPVITAGVEVRRDRLRYHFDNPSSADTSFLVPHFFEQAYDADNLWFVGTARYFAGRMESSGGITLSRPVPATDFDTFFDPGNIVIVSGTSGEAAAQSVVVSHRAEIARAGQLAFSLGYRLRWDRFDFGVGHKTVTRNAILISATDVTSPEMTDSKVHEFPAGVRVTPLIGRWRLDVSAEISPLTLARLSVQLPEKYPGQDLVFFAKAAAASARIALIRTDGRWPIEVAMEIDRAWSYGSTDRVSRSAQSVALSAGRRW